MALEGTIKEFGLADIFQLIGLQKKTGTLFLKGDEGTVNIHFEDGMVVKTEDSQMRSKYLSGRILISRGKINEEKLKEALEIQKSTAQKLGNVLISQGFINKDDLREVLSYQMGETIYKVFRWRGGDYKFYQDKVDYDRDTVVPISSEHILMDGVRMLDEWPLIEKKLPSQDIVLKKNEAKSFSLEEDMGDGDIFTGFDAASSSSGGVAKESSSILNLVDGKKSIYEIVEYSSLGEFDTCKVLVELLEKGYILKTDAKPEFMLEEAPPASREKVRPKVEIEKLPYAFIALALILIFLQVTGTRKIMNAKETHLEGLKVPFAVNHLERVYENSVLYYMDFGSYPEKISSLAELDYISGSDAIDPWGKALVIRADDRGGIAVASAGSDMTLGTADDITSRP